MLTLLSFAAQAQEPPPPAATVGAPAPSPPVSFRLSFVPGVGVNADPDDAVDGFATGFVSRQTALEGMDLELGLSWVDGTMEGAQVSMLGNVAGDVEGMQLALGANWARGEVRFSQLSLGANVAEGDVYGFQGSTGVNVALHDLVGFQASPWLNLAVGSSAQGVQASSGVNVARTMMGVQAAPLNVADRIEGVQVGLLNVGNEVDGLQLGLVNVARRSKVSLAPINIIGDGLHHVDVWASDSAIANAALKFGSKHMYTLLGVGWVNPRQSWWTFGGGWGAHLQRDDLWLEIDDSVWGIAQANVVAPGVHNKLRAQVGWALRDRFQPFAGVSMNTWVGTGSVWPRPEGPPTVFGPERQIVAWPGFHAGLSI